MRRVNQKGEQMKTAAIYCRVSTEDQEKEGTSLQTQLEACLKYCQSRGYDVAQRFSEAYSGLTLERPKLNELRELAGNGQIDVIVVYCLDRLSRDPTHGVILAQEFEKHGVTLEAVSETVESTELGKLISYIRGFASKLEAEKIKERTMRGKRAKVMRGELPQGTGVGLYGYVWNKETKRREVNPPEADIVGEIFTRVATRESLVSIARRLNERHIWTKQRKLWHPLTIRNMVRNSSYIGQTRLGNSVLSNVTPAIVEEDIFHMANAELDRPKVRTGRPKNEYLLRNHAFCAICGRPLVGHCLNRKYRYYQCNCARPYVNNKRQCPALYVRADELEETVWSKTKEVLADPEVILGQLSETTGMGNLEAIEAEKKELEKTLRNYEQRRANLLQALELGEFEADEVLDRVNNLKRLRREDEAKLKEVRRIRENLTSLRNAKIKLHDLYSRVMDNLENATQEIKRLALDALDIKVYATADKTEIQGMIPLELALPTTERTSA
jgi:site-specific DNA recombinase